MASVRMRDGGERETERERNKPTTAQRASDTANLSLYYYLASTTEISIYTENGGSGGGGGESTSGQATPPGGWNFTEIALGPNNTVNRLAGRTGM